MKEIKTVAMSIDTWQKLNKKRGYDGCMTFEEVIIRLLGQPRIIELDTDNAEEIEKVRKELQK